MGIKQESTDSNSTELEVKKSIKMTETSAKSDGKCPNGTKAVNGANGTVDCVAIVEPKVEPVAENTTVAEKPKDAPTMDTAEEEKPKEEEEQVNEASLNVELKMNVDFAFVQAHQEQFVEDFVTDL